VTHPNDFYLVATASFTGRSRLWRLRFVDASQPWLGGTATMLLDGSEGQHMMDNIGIRSARTDPDLGGSVPPGSSRQDLAVEGGQLLAVHVPPGRQY
jgi:hypothetical protein